MIKTINAVAPIRICDLGGWTDTWFAQYGTVLNIAVYPYTEVQMKIYKNIGKNNRKIKIHAENFGAPYEIDPNNIIYDKHPLIEAAIDIMKVPKEFSFEINLFSNAPSGASTGTSAAITVALIAALDLVTPGKLTPYEIALLSHDVETVKLGQQCGIQDQIASAYGGINFIQMTQYPHSSVSQLIIPNHTWWELERRLILIYLGKSHFSSEVHRRVIKNLEGYGPTHPILEKLRNIASLGKNSLYQADFSAFGKAMIMNNEYQRLLHPDLISSDADSVIQVAKKNGAIGWKVNGAGGSGGSLTILSGPDASSKRKIIREVEDLNAGFKNIPMYISRFGLRTWKC